MPVPIQRFPVLAPPGFVATARDTNHRGSECANSAGHTYRTYGQPHPPERPLLYNSFEDQRTSGAQHHATDILCPRGVPVVSTTDGHVMTEWRYRGERRPGAGQSEQGGWYVKIQDTAGNKHYYAHMKDLLVRSGDRVRAGQQIGTCWDSGNARGGCPHLHYGIRDPSGRAINPYDLLRPMYQAGAWRGSPRGGGSGTGPAVAVKAAFVRAPRWVPAALLIGATTIAAALTVWAVRRQRR